MIIINIIIFIIPSFTVLLLLLAQNDRFDFSVFFNAFTPGKVSFGFMTIRIILVLMVSHSYLLKTI